MSWWTQSRMLGIDLETTGVDTLNDRIVTVSVVDVVPGQRPVTWSRLVDPGVEIPAEAQAVHGISTERARAEGLDPAQVLFEAAGMIALASTHGVPLVLFNAAFDLTMFEAECARHGVEGLRQRVAPRPVGPVIDPFVLDKAMSRRKGSRKLVDQCAFYNVTLAGAHSSTGDALAAVRLASVLIERYPALQADTPGLLHMAQVAMRVEQQDSLRAYFDRTGVDHDGCDGSWPLYSTLPAVEAVSA